MQKKIMYTVLIICLCVCIYGQQPSMNEKYHNTYLFCGISVSTFTDYIDDDWEQGSAGWRPAFLNIGVSHWFNTSKGFVFEPGVRIVQKGAGTDLIFLSYEFNLSYIDIFLKTKYNIVNKFYPYAGFSTGFLFDQSLKVKFFDMENTKNPEFDVLDLSIPLGIDIKLNNRVVLGFEYCLGILGPSPDYTNRMILCSLGFLF